MTDDLAGQLTGTILGLRNSTGARANLRRGNSPATEHYAYPYLAPLWNEHGEHFRVPILRAAALAATASAIDNDPDVALGTFLRRVALRDVAGGSDATQRALDRVGRRLVWAQTGDVDKLHLALRQLVTNSAGIPAVSWRDVTCTYLWWDQRNLEPRRRHRRRVLERFYSHAPTVTNSTAPETGIDAATAAAPKEQHQ